MYDDTQEICATVLQAAEQASITEIQWLHWIDEVEALLGHSADGDESLDGYSLDGAYDAYRAGFTPVEYWQGV